MSDTDFYFRMPVITEDYYAELTFYPDNGTVANFPNDEVAIEVFGPVLRRVTDNGISQYDVGRTTVVWDIAGWPYDPDARPAVVGYLEPFSLFVYEDGDRGNDGPEVSVEGRAILNPELAPFLNVAAEGGALYVFFLPVDNVDGPLGGERIIRSGCCNSVDLQLRSVPGPGMTVLTALALAMGGLSARRRRVNH